MKKRWQTAGILLALAFSFSSHTKQLTTTYQQAKKGVTAKDILGNPQYLAISYGGYRLHSRELQPTVAQLKADMKILAAMQVRVLRTYNTRYAEAANLLTAIRALKQEDPDFEMYAML
ncbi:MAG: glycosyl hydrolase family 17, partial [Saprospiraceae bacterium]